MLAAYGWAIARSSRDAYVDAPASELDSIDEQVARADSALFVKLRAFLGQFTTPDLDWRFIPQLNYVHGVLSLASATNHRGQMPTIVTVLHWLAEHGPSSYGIVYLHDDEDSGAWAQARGRSGEDLTNVFRVWRLRRGRVDELEDPFLSPIVPALHPVQA